MLARARVTPLAGTLLAAAAIVGCAVQAQASPSLSVRVDRPAVRPGVWAGFSATCAPPPATCDWTFDDGGTATGARVVHSFATAGRHVVTVRSDGASATVEEVVDGTPPAMRVSTSDGHLHVAATDDLAGVVLVEASVDGRGFGPVDEDGIPLYAGFHRVTVRAGDAAGNVGYLDTSVRLGAHGPAVSLAAPPMSVKWHVHARLLVNARGRGVARVMVDRRHIRRHRFRLTTRAWHVLTVTDRRGSSTRLTFRVKRLNRLTHHAWRRLGGLGADDQLQFGRAVRGRAARRLIHQTALRLRALHFLRGKVRRDRYGWKLLDAVKRFQASVGLPHAGRGYGTIGPQTRRALDRALRRPPQRLWLAGPRP